MRTKASLSNFSVVAMLCDLEPLSEIERVCVHCVCMWKVFSGIFLLVCNIDSPTLALFRSAAFLNRVSCVSAHLPLFLLIYFTQLLS